MTKPLDTHEIFAALADEKWQIKRNFKGKDIISVLQFDWADIMRVLGAADDLEGRPYKETSKILHGKNLSVLFYQPSTRTYTSFIRAGQELGAKVHGIHGMQDFSSAYKGESLPDTVRTIHALGADAIILRHFSDDSALIAASNVDIPVINAGSGKLEHPTQALLDVRTIINETGGRNPADVHIVFVGDLKYGRTVHSLSQLMAILGTRQMTFVSPEVLKMPRRLLTDLQERGVETHETEHLDDVLAEADVLYITRVQQEWFETEEAYHAARTSQQITREVMSKAKPDAVLMHPLPRIDEILPEVDDDPRAAYFRQVRNGLFVRMALLRLVLGD